MDEKTLRKTYGMVAGLVVIATAMSAWGWPELMRRRQATHAMEVLGQIARGAHIYYVKPRLGDYGERMACQFPQGKIFSTPAASCCDSSVRLDGTNHCDPAKTDWNRSLWNALKVEVKEPQGFVYHYEASGTFADARYKITAISDLDCDGVYATYVYEGQGDSKAVAENCVLNTRPTFRAINLGE
ncbi:MAG TPA: hypothetical protein DCQ06_10180 [Myxococcales bacterium]|nr:hypothetical protein [Myxococcales bacterium]